MKTSTKLLIFVGSALVLGVAGYFIYKKMKGTPKGTAKAEVKEGEDLITLEVTNTDWANRAVTFRVLLNGKVYMSEKINWENKYMGSEFGFVGSPLYSAKNKIEVVGANLTNGIILVVKSNGVNKTGKIINFATKNITDYNGANLGEDIAKAKEVSKAVLNSILGFSMFNGENSSNADNTPAPNPYNHTQKWVYIIENGKDYCRWFDSKGKNTVTYEKPCNLAQANMYAPGGSYYKKKKKDIFGRVKN
jgi:hypothetical protein